MKFSEYLAKEGIELQEAKKIAEYLSKNKSLYLAFESAAKTEISQGAEYLRAKKIIEILRDDPRLLKTEKFKITNSITSYLARAFVYKNPQYGKFFRFNKIKGIQLVEEAQQVPLLKKAS